MEYRKINFERRKEITELVADANMDIERAYWRLKKITQEEIEALGFNNRFNKTVRLLGKLDDLTMTIYGIVKPIEL